MQKFSMIYAILVIFVRVHYIIITYEIYFVNMLIKRYLFL
nr:MAG TPA: hypothetical protein [Caudoviricetes sp.]